MTTKMWKSRDPFEYELTPVEIDKGTSWLTLKLKNMRSVTLEDLDIQLHSLDTYNLTVYGTWGIGAGHYIAYLGPSEEREVVFRVNAVGSAIVYATIKARKAGKYFWWESGWTYIKLGEEKAEIGRLLVLSHRIRQLERPSVSRQPLRACKKVRD
jgi:hypothetical protein